MTTQQTILIRQLRMKGFGYKAIGSNLGLSRDIVRNYCRANGLDGHANALTLNIKEKIETGSICIYCGGEIQQPKTGRKKKYCTDACRRAWWSAHPELTQKKENALYKIKCECCGEIFESYGNKHRKYCSHNCYIKNRFW